VEEVSAQGYLYAPFGRTGTLPASTTAPCGGASPGPITGRAGVGTPFNVTWTQSQGVVDVYIAYGGLVTANGSAFQKLTSTSIQAPTTSTNVVFNSTCTSCTLQWVLTSGSTSYYCCADISISSKAPLSSSESSSSSGSSRYVAPIVVGIVILIVIIAFVVVVVFGLIATLLFRRFRMNKSLN